MKFLKFVSVLFPVYIIINYVTIDDGFVRDVITFMMMSFCMVFCIFVYYKVFMTFKRLAFMALGQNPISEIHVKPESEIVYQISKWLGGKIYNLRKGQNAQIR